MLDFYQTFIEKKKERKKKKVRKFNVGNDKGSRGKRTGVKLNEKFQIGNKQNLRDILRYF